MPIKKNSQKKTKNIVYQPLQQKIISRTVNEFDGQVKSYPCCFVLVTVHLDVKPKIHNNGQLTQVSSCWYSNNSYFSYATMTLLATVRTIIQHASNLHKINLKYKILEGKLF